MGWPGPSGNEPFSRRSELLSANLRLIGSNHPKEDPAFDLQNSGLNGTTINFVMKST
jgi:hypothetical protein